MNENNYVNGYASITLPVYLVNQGTSLTIEGIYDKLKSIYICNKILYVHMFPDSDGGHSIARAIIYVGDDIVLIKPVDVTTDLSPDIKFAVYPNNSVARFDG